MIQNSLFKYAVESLHKKSRQKSIGCDSSELNREFVNKLSADYVNSKIDALNK